MIRPIEKSSKSLFFDQVLELLQAIQLSIPFFLGASSGVQVQYNPMNGVYTAESSQTSSPDFYAERFGGEHLGRWHLVVVLNWLVEILEDDGRGAQRLPVPLRMLEALKQQLENVKSCFGRCARDQNLRAT